MNHFVLAELLFIFAIDTNAQKVVVSRGIDHVQIVEIQGKKVLYEGLPAKLEGLEARMREGEELTLKEFEDRIEVKSR